MTGNIGITTGAGEEYSTDLKKLQSEYKMFRSFGYNQDDAVESATRTLKNSIHIHKDEYGNPSHVFSNNEVLFFEGGIYSKV